MVERRPVKTNMRVQFSRVTPKFRGKEDCVIPKRLIRIGDIITTKHGYTGRVTKIKTRGIILNGKVLVEKMNYIRKYYCIRTGSTFINDWALTQKYMVGKKYDDNCLDI